MKKIVILAGVLALHTSGIAKAPELAQTQHTNATRAALAGLNANLTFYADNSRATQALGLGQDLSSRDLTVVSTKNLALAQNLHQNLGSSSEHSTSENAKNLHGADLSGADLDSKDPNAKDFTGRSVSLTPTLAKSAQAQNVLRNLVVFSGRGGGNLLKGSDSSHFKPQLSNAGKNPALAPNFAQQQPINAQNLQGKGLDGRDLAGVGNKNLTLYADNSALQRQGAQGLGQDLDGGDLSSKDPNAKDPNNQSAINKAIYLAQNDFNTSRPMSAEEAMTLDSVIVSDEQSADEAGLDSVYENDQVTLFKTKKDLESYRGVNVSDLLSGFEGVYSGDARNSGALDPNIRGVQGQGRIPITVDNTEQSISIWRGFAGVSNRNYLDPSLIAGVKVQKGPSLDRNLKGGVGGSISMRTLDPSDIVKSGEKWGAEIKLESATNSIKQRNNPFSKIGQDYRELGLQGNNLLLGEWALFFREDDKLDARSGKGKRYNPLNDKAARIAIATKQENFEALLAYAYRNKGNYFAGRNGAKKYGLGLTYDDILKKLDNQDIDDPSIPFIAAFYKPNYEVANTNMQTKSLLFKNNWFLGDYKLKFMYRNTSLKAGEMMPSRLFLAATRAGTVIEWPQAHTKQNALDLGLEYKPPFDPYINFEANVWSVFNDSKTNTSGGSPGDVLWQDVNHSKYYQCQQGKNVTEGCDKFPYPLATPGLPKELFETQEAQAQYNKDNHYGLNLSNKFSFSDELDLSLMASFNYEDLDSDNVYGRFGYKFLQDKYKKFLDEQKIQEVPNRAASGPRKGKRHELNIGTNLNYKPAEWLALNAGLKFTNYETKDDYYSEYIKKQYRENKEKARVPIGKAFAYDRLYTATEKAKYDAIRAKGTAYKPTMEEKDFLDRVSEANPGSQTGYIRDYIVWRNDKYGRLRAENFPRFDGRMDELLSHIHEKGTNLVTGAQVYRIKAIYPQAGNCGDSNKQCARPTQAQWDKMIESKKSASGFSPSVGATAFLGSTRFYTRYAHFQRMPSIFEDTYGFKTDFNSDLELAYERKPEISKNFEIGFVQDLSRFLSARRADVRLNYYYNVTENIFDRDVNFQMLQFDERTLSGLEIQGRYDLGFFYTNLGLHRSLKNVLCDAGAALSDDQGGPNSYLSKGVRTEGKTKEQIDKAVQDFRNVKYLPKCVNGGSGGGYLKNAIQPKYSFNADLGFRFLGGRLETGARTQYHSRAYDTREKSLQDAGVSIGTSNAVRWQAIHVYDAYVRYAASKNFSVEAAGMNLTDEYYIDPMTRSVMPAPGRSFRFAMTAGF